MYQLIYDNYNLFFENIENLQEYICDSNTEINDFIVTMPAGTLDWRVFTYDDQEKITMVHLPNDTVLLHVYRVPVA